MLYLVDDGFFEQQYFECVAIAQNSVAELDDVKKFANALVNGRIELFVGVFVLQFLDQLVLSVFQHELVGAERVLDKQLARLGLLVQLVQVLVQCLVLALAIVDVFSGFFYVGVELFEAAALHVANALVAVHRLLVAGHHTVAADGRLASDAEKFEAFARMLLAEDGLVDGHAAVDQKFARPLVRLVLVVHFGRGRGRRRARLGRAGRRARWRLAALVVHHQPAQIRLVRVFYLLELDHSVAVKAAHVLVRAHTVWTQKVSALCAPRHRLLVALAARAAQRSLLDGQHVQHVVHHIVVLQIVHPGSGLDWPAKHILQNTCKQLSSFGSLSLFLHSRHTSDSW
ncbi:hypothetical protein BpHYR1_045135 [Brachionus plicatilis]|uniref:Uncharacterized protein n=1 Tax=Brachionus plicatilis TaxID=10195 RepID=A0A3M7QQ88_BRAPC|nr:hypothetical protein BpHYR1_045135 [Brachionus plicatilis]